MDPASQHVGDPAAPASAPDPSFIAMADPSSFTIPILYNGTEPDLAAAAAPPASSNRAITADEIALYDRQIRLWGMAAQAKIQSANILLITIRALANEIAKNLVLAGIHSLTLLDDAPVSEADIGAQFLLVPEHDAAAAAAPSSLSSSSPTNTADTNTAAPTAPSEPRHPSSSSASSTKAHPLLGLNRAQAALPALQRLNPRVLVRADPAGVPAKPPSYFSSFDIIIATDLDPHSFHLINTAARIHGKPFYAAGTHGLYGFIFSDLIEHDFVIRRAVGNIPARIGPETRTRSVVAIAHENDTDNNNNNNNSSSGSSGSSGSSEKRGNPRAAPKIEAVTKRELYSTWFLASDAALLPPEFTKSRRRLRAVSPTLSCLRALWAFTLAHPARLPPSTRDDVRLFTQLATQKHRALGLPAETLRPELLRSFLQNLGCEIPPTAAILGGQLAQDVINVLGQTQQPIQNLVVFDGNTLDAPMYAFHPDGPIGAALLSTAASLGPVVPPPDMLPGLVPARRDGPPSTSN